MGAVVLGSQHCRETLPRERRPGVNLTTAAEHAYPQGSLVNTRNNYPVGPTTPALQYGTAAPHMAPLNAYHSADWHAHSYAASAAGYAAQAAGYAGPPAGYAAPASYAVAPAGYAATPAAHLQGDASRAAHHSTARPYAPAGVPAGGRIPPPPRPAAASAVPAAAGADGASKDQQQQEGGPAAAAGSGEEQQGSAAVPDALEAAAAAEDSLAASPRDAHWHWVSWASLASVLSSLLPAAWY